MPVKLLIAAWVKNFTRMHSRMTAVAGRKPALFTALPLPELLGVDQGAAWWCTVYQSHLMVATK